MAETVVNSLKNELSLFDSISIIVGIIIGAGIYETAPAVAAGMGGPAGTLGIWVLGGLLVLAGAFTYAELATTYPEDGGDYVYLKRAYGPGGAFLFGWSHWIIVRPGDIALMAFIFGRYAETLYAPFSHSRVLYAAGAVACLTLINILGVRQGKTAQNILTTLKVLALVAIVGLGFMGTPNTASPDPSAGSTAGGMPLALILVLFTFGGWHEIAYVAAEVKHPARNIVRTLVMGTCAVTALYVLVNGAFLYALGYGLFSSSQAVAVDAVARTFPGTAERIIAVIICVSTLGAVNGLIFTGARISYALGRDYPAFHRLGQWNPKRGAPVWALVVQGVISLAIVWVAGSFIDTLLYTAPVFWLFFLATGISIFVLRRRDPQRRRPFQRSGYPVMPLVFCACCMFMVYNCVTYAFKYRPAGLLILSGALMAGLIVYYILRSVHREGRRAPG